MRLSRTAYHADFVIYAALVATLAAIAACSADRTAVGKWFATFVFGAALWSLLEYLLHRFVLHQWPTFAAMHAEHHAAPRAFVGTPTWVTLGVLWTIFFLPECYLWSFNVASGLIGGVMMGFLWYGVLHHVIHHGHPRALYSLLSKSADRHRQHHYSGRAGNFGVTTSIWDRLFGTAIERRAAKPGTAVAAGLPGRRR
jgi:sterol desaturase/sphingolipid hydroxylase (fatty acid hydroxylase superfamily)